MLLVERTAARRRRVLELVVIRELVPREARETRGRYQEFPWLLLKHCHLMVTPPGSLDLAHDWHLGSFPLPSL